MSSPRRVLVFRLGSIGDFLISLPCFHLVRKLFPLSEITLLTNIPANSRAAPAEAILDGTGLVDRYLKYQGGVRDPQHLASLRNEIRAFAPDILIYLAAPRGPLSVYRDFLFFQWCGIKRIVGVPVIPSLLNPRPPAPGTMLWESEARRLGRQISSLGNINFDLAENWDLHLSDDETTVAKRVLSRVEDLSATRSGSRRLVGLSIGTKQEVNDWGDENWQAVLNGLEPLDFALVLVGGMEDRDRSQRLAEGWPGPSVNLCGLISPRATAAVLRRMDLFFCHDSGPMHLASAVGTRCVAVFSRRNPPGPWFPFGPDHDVLYPSSPSGSIYSIPPRQVVAAAVRMLQRHPPVPNSA
jgi:heptosyltransferase III